MFDCKRTLFIAASLTAAVWAGASVVQADEGAELWAKNCKMCHGETGKADSKVGESMKIRDLTAPAVHATLDKAKVVKAIKEGVKNEAAPGKDMKPLGAKFTDAQIDLLAAHVMALK